MTVNKLWVQSGCEDWLQITPAMFLATSFFLEDDKKKKREEKQKRQTQKNTANPRSPFFNQACRHQTSIGTPKSKGALDRQLPACRTSIIIQVTPPCSTKLFGHGSRQTTESGSLLRNHG